jgi:hypothetical protein
MMQVSACMLQVLKFPVDEASRDKQHSDNFFFGKRGGGAELLSHLWRWKVSIKRCGCRLSKHVEEDVVCRSSS